MKKLLIVSLIALGVSATAWAGQENSRHAGSEASRLARFLDVSEEQLPAFQNIVEDYSAKRRELMQEHRQQIQTLEADRNTELSGVLTPEQLTKMEQLNKQRHGNWRDGKRPHPERGQSGERKRGGNASVEGDTATE